MFKIIKKLKQQFKYPILHDWLQIAIDCIIMRPFIEQALTISLYDEYVSTHSYH